MPPSLGHIFEGFISYVRFQVLTAASMMFRAVFWVVLPLHDSVLQSGAGEYTQCLLLNRSKDTGKYCI
jgi:hypothetical protein